MLSSSQHQRALRGLLMLKETYNLSVEDLLSGRLRMRSPAADEGGVSERDFSSCHSLTVHDLVDLAGTAVMDGWIDDAVELTRAGVRLIEEGDLVSSIFLVLKKCLDLYGWLILGSLVSKDGRSDISRILMPSPYHPTAGL